MLHSGWEARTYPAPGHERYCSLRVEGKGHSLIDPSVLPARLVVRSPLDKGAVHEFLELLLYENGWITLHPPREADALFGTIDLSVWDAQKYCFPRWFDCSWHQMRSLSASASSLYTHRPTSPSSSSIANVLSYLASSPNWSAKQN